MEKCSWLAIITTTQIWDNIKYRENKDNQGLNILVGITLFFQICNHIYGGDEKCLA